MDYGKGDSRRLPGHLMCQICFVCLSVVLSSAQAQVEFRWLFGPWGSCEHASCGPGGRKYREVWCMHVPTGHRVLDSYCEPDFKPASGSECHRSCSESMLVPPPSDRGETKDERPFYEYRDYDHDEWKPGMSQTGNQDEAPFRSGSGSEDDEEDTAVRRGSVGRELTGGRSESGVEWVIEPWSSCKLAPGAEVCGRNLGIQFRNVTCERRDKLGTAPLFQCLQEESMPPSNQSCELLCPQNCVVSDYSDWTRCDVACNSVNQTRTRHVIVPPRHRGHHCPSLSETSPCENCSHFYTYKFSEWQPCTPFGGSYLGDVKVHHSIGYQTREISCLQSKGVLTSLRFCSDRLPGTTLEKHRACLMPQDCQVSPWTSLLPYNTSCIGHDGLVNHGFMVRTRQVLQLPLGGGQPCPAKLIEFIKLTKEDPQKLRPCKSAKWVVSSWSQCQSVPGYSHCGIGVQSRRVLCLEAAEEGTERPVEDTRCSTLKPPSAQSCAMECSWDCSVSQWSSWSTCEDSECDTPNMRRRSHLRRRRSLEGSIGKSFRTREVLTLPGPGGQACPHLSESRSCQPDPCYTWNVTLGPCESTTRGGCGNGTQLKKALCLNRAGVKVRERFCHESLHMEQNWANCYVPCPDDCILSEWAEWSACPDPCQVQFGAAVVRYRQRQILAYQGPGRVGRPCPNTSDLRESDACPVLQDCATYQWETSGWGPCTLNSNSLSVQCGPGIQTRSVDCYTSLGVPAPVTKCTEKVRPKSNQTCVIECPVDCHVTEWSGWSDCGVKCLPVMARQMYPTQARRRFILQYPQNGGLTCPSDLKEEQSCFGLPVCETYHWQMTEWSDCVVPPIVPLCGQGLRARNLTCFYSDALSTKEMPLVTCLERLGSMPDMAEVCYVPCDSECHFSPWSQWTACGPQCQKSRFRFRRLSEFSRNNPECRDTELYPRDQHQDCVCDTSQPAHVGGWSDCIIPAPSGEDVRFASMSLTSISARFRRTNETGVTGLGPQIYCGQGKKYMAISCHEADQEIIGSLVCTGEDYTEDNCTVPCPVDCKTTEWSSWSACTFSCGPGVQQRERRIMVLPENKGRKCPSMSGQDKETQTRVCTTSCSYHRWKVESWGACVPRETRSCGEGTHSRTVRCVSFGEERTEMTVDSSFCQGQEEPQAVKVCSLPCPGECVMSEWTDWTMCRQPCNGKQTQSRVQHVLRSAASSSGVLACSTQREERNCERWKNCIEYSWELSDWTSCLVNGGRNECGVGHKERFPLCRNDKGETVETLRCEQLFGPVSEPLVVSCEIPCDNDCLLSDWSEWSSCSSTCGLGFSHRKITVLRHPVGNGRQCPERLEQSKPCFKKDCFRWFISEWGQCILPKGVCGSGIRERNVTCMNDEGRSVNTSRCPVDPEILILQTSQPCRVPCPGECRMSEWSAWAECFISCQDFAQGYKVGQQSRSRAVVSFPAPGNPPCDDAPWEERMCSATSCTKFSWVTSNWDPTSNTREVFCVSNEGVRVVGGCNDSQIPPRVLNCQNPACQSPALCVDTDTCSCPPQQGLMEFLLDPVTVTCVMNVSSGMDKATSSADMNSHNIWMYAVIAVGTLIIIAVTAALYNMCELFRTGPRPRRKDECSREGSTAGTVHSADGIHSYEKGTATTNSIDRKEKYRQLGNHSDHVGSYLLADTATSCSPSPSPSSTNQTSVITCNSHQLSDLDVATSPSEFAPLTKAASLLTPLTVDVSSRTLPSDEQRLKTCKQNNRRFKQRRRLLPARIARCFICQDRARNSAVDHPDHNVETCGMKDLVQNHNAQIKTGFVKSELKSGKDQILYRSADASFHNHSCMLSLAVHSNNHLTNPGVHSINHLTSPLHEDVLNSTCIDSTVRQDQIFLTDEGLQDNTVTSSSPVYLSSSEDVCDTVFNPPCKITSFESVPSDDPSVYRELDHVKFFQLPCHFSINSNNVNASKSRSKSVKIISPSSSQNEFKADLHKLPSVDIYSPSTKTNETNLPDLHSYYLEKDCEDTMNNSKDLIFNQEVYDQNISSVDDNLIRVHNQNSNTLYGHKRKPKSTLTTQVHEPSSSHIPNISPVRDLQHDSLSFHNITQQKMKSSPPHSFDCCCPRCKQYQISNSTSRFRTDDLGDIQNCDLTLFLSKVAQSERQTSIPLYHSCHPKDQNMNFSQKPTKGRQFQPPSLSTKSNSMPTSTSSNFRLSEHSNFSIDSHDPVRSASYQVFDFSDIETSV